MSAHRQIWLQAQASSALASGGMRGLYRWYSDIAPADQVLIEDFIIRPGSIPVDVKPEPEEAEPEVVEVEEIIPDDITPEEFQFGYYQVCPHCDAEQLTKNKACCMCGYSLKIKEAA